MSAVEERLRKIELAITAMAKEFYSDEQPRDDNGRFGSGGGGGGDSAPKSGGGPGRMAAGEKAAAAAKAQATADRFKNASTPRELLDKWQNGKGNFAEQQQIARQILASSGPAGAKADELLRTPKADRDEAAKAFTPDVEKQYNDKFAEVKADRYSDQDWNSQMKGFGGGEARAAVREFKDNPTPETLAKADAWANFMAPKLDAYDAYGRSDSVSQQIGHLAVDDVRQEIKAEGGDIMDPLGLGKNK